MNVQSYTENFGRSLDFRHFLLYARVKINPQTSGLNSPCLITFKMELFP